MKLLWPQTKNYGYQPGDVKKGYQPQESGTVPPTPPNGGSSIMPPQNKGN